MRPSPFRIPECEFPPKTKLRNFIDLAGCMFYYYMRAFACVGIEYMCKHLTIFIRKIIKKTPRDTRYSPKWAKKKIVGKFYSQGILARTQKNLLNYLFSSKRVYIPTWNMYISHMYETHTIHSYDPINLRVPFGTNWIQFEFSWHFNYGSVVCHVFLRCDDNDDGKLVEI